MSTLHSTTPNYIRLLLLLAGAALGASAQSMADIEVTALSVSPVNPSPGQSVVVSFTIRNSGSILSQPFTNTVYWSTNSTISVADTVLGSKAMNATSAGSSRLDSMSVTIPSNALPNTTYYIGLIADSSNTVTPEPNDANNIRGIPVTVSSAAGLTVTVNNVPGGLQTVPATGQGRVCLYDRNAAARGCALTNSSRQAIFSGLDAALSPFYYDVFNDGGAFGLTEQWGRTSGLTLTAGVQTPSSFTRKHAYATNIQIVNKNTNQELSSSSVIPPGTPLKAVVYATIPAGGQSFGATSGRIRLDLGRNGTTDSTHSCSTTTILIGSIGNFTCELSTPASGAYSFGAEITSGTAVVDTWTWVPTFTVSASPGSLLVTVNNVAGGSAAIPQTGAGKVCLYDKNGAAKGCQFTNSSRQVTFTNLDTALSPYWFDVRNEAGAFSQSEYWGRQDNVTISSGTTLPVIFTRKAAYVSAVKFFDVLDNNREMASGSSIPGGRPMSAVLTVAVPSGASSGSITATIRLDRDRNGTMDREFACDPVTIVPGNSGTSTCKLPPLASSALESGAYNFGIIAKASAVVTDTWTWTTGPVISPRTYGTTVITHGFQPINDDPIDDWMSDLACRILQYRSEGVGRILAYNRTTGTFERGDGRIVCGIQQTNTGGETILLFDWARESDIDANGYSEAAGDALQAALLRLHLANPGVLRNLHMIGHSRGTVVNSEAAERLLRLGAAVSPAVTFTDLQITNLDAHDWGAAGIASDSDVNPDLWVGTQRGGVWTWTGTTWADSYWQQGTAGLSGRAVAGSYQRQLNTDTELNCNDAWINCHSEVHQWYRNTISDIYSPAGFAFSRLGGQQSRRPAVNHGSPLAPRYSPIADGVFNGDLSKGSIAGWLGAGGGGTATWDSGQLYFTASGSHSHNDWFVPVGVRGVRFSYSSGGAGTATLEILTKDATGERLATGLTCGGQPMASIALSSLLATQVECQFDVAPNLVSKVTFRVSNLLVSLRTLRIDNLRFVTDNCTYSLGSQLAQFTSAGGSFNFPITTQTGCPWSATSNQSWLTTSSAGSGSGTVAIAVAANPSTSPRAGAIAVGGLTFSVSQAGLCTYSLNPTSVNPTAAGGSFSFSVTTQSGCPWTAVSNANWVTTSSSGAGSGTINYTVQANTAQTGRSTTITVAGQSFTITQPAIICVFSLTPTSANPTAAGGASSFSVTTQSGCPWTAASNANWVTTSSSGAGSGNVNYTVQANTAQTGRSTTITVAGQSFTITQPAIICVFSLTPTSASVSSTATSGTFQVNVAAGCPWSAASNSSWLTTSSTGSGAGAVTYSVAANANATTRTATINVAGQSFSLTQAAGPTTDGRATLIQPTNGAQLGSTRVIFAWTTGTGASSFRLDVGSAPGQGDFFSTTTAATTVEVTNIPCGGQFVYARLTTLIGSQWLTPIDYSFVQSPCPTPDPAKIQLPAPSSTITRSDPTFSWTPGTGALSYWLDLGTVVASGDLFAREITATSVQVTGLPCNLQPLHAQLWTRTAAGWQPPNRYLYTVDCDTTARITSPIPNSPLPPNPVTFTWDPVAGASDYWLDVGTEAGKGDIFGSVVAASSKSVDNIRCDLSTIHVQLWTRISGAWQTPNRYTYSPAIGCVSEFRPTPGSTLPGPDVTFSWLPEVGASDYWLDVGTIRRQGNIFGRVVTGTNQPVTGIPCGGVPIYVQLWKRVNGLWPPPAQYTYTAAPSSQCPESPANLSSPTAGSTLTTTSTTFTWTAGSGALEYWLDVGTQKGQGNIFGGALTSLSRQIGNLPCGGQPLWVRLWTRFAGGWSQPLDYSFTAGAACGGDPRAMLTAPVGGITLAAPTQTFVWSAGTGATAYWLDVGTTLGQGNLYGSQLSGTSRQVSNLPCAGNTIFVRLWTQTASGWQTPLDYAFVCSAP